jgi:hypothetical protein
MVPIVLGILILVAVLIYHIINNKEGFEDKGPNEYQLLMFATVQKMPKEEAEKLSKKFNELEQINDSSADKIMPTLLSAIELMRPYFSNEHLKFDEFKLRLTDFFLTTMFKDVNIAETEEKNIPLLSQISTELTKLKVIANVTEELESEKTIKKLINYANEHTGSGIMEKIRPLVKKEFEISASAMPIANLTGSVPFIIPSPQQLNTPSEQQGSDFRSSSCPPPCPNACESDDYIRKDSIPCWNCNIPQNN